MGEHREARELFKNKYLRADDIPTQGVTVTIAACVEAQISRERKAVVSFDEIDQALVLNRTNWTALEDLYGEESDDWIGCHIVLYRTATELNGEPREGIRLRGPAKACGESQSSDGDIPF